MCTLEDRPEMLAEFRGELSLSVSIFRTLISGLLILLFLGLLIFQWLCLLQTKAFESSSQGLKFSLGVLGDLHDTDESPLAKVVK